MTDEARRGDDAAAVRAMPCLVRARAAEAVNRGSFENENCNCLGPVVAAHVTARGMGAAKGGRFDLVPLCRLHHREAGEARTSQRAAFERRYDLDLRAEADRTALAHERPLGLRGLADRRVKAQRVHEVAAIARHELEVGVRMQLQATGAGALLVYEPLSTYELGALLGWVSREMAREVERREEKRCWPDYVEPGCQWDGLADNDREALASHIRGKLGGDFERDPGGEHGLAWTLCEAAAEKAGGWPS